MKLKPIDSGSTEFSRMLEVLAERRNGGSNGVDRNVAAIIEAVRKRGDRALVEFTERYDGVKMPLRQLRTHAGELARSLDRIPRAERKALELAARRIREFHRRTLAKSFVYEDSLGVSLGQIVRPLDRIGIYVPGGQGAYPSSVLMSAIPAQVAGVPEIVMVSPPSTGQQRDAVLGAAAIAGVTEAYSVGGAQAVAALAYGTERIRPVDKIVGPGNAYVQAAKRMVFGAVDIDNMAGPSEVLVIADGAARADWVAADLIAQAEHGSGDESAILLTPSRQTAERIAAALESALTSLPRASSVGKVLAKRSALVIVKSLKEAFDLANRIAPEHLELEIADAEKWVKAVRSAGAVFVGAMSPAPLGDYLAGPNHVLPTGGTARFASPLGAYDFIKRISIIRATAHSLRRLGPAVARMARMEGFEGHARAVEMRIAANGARNIRHGNGRKKEQA